MGVESMALGSDQLNEIMPSIYLLPRSLPCGCFIHGEGEAGRWPTEASAWPYHLTRLPLLTTAQDSNAPSLRTGAPPQRRRVCSLGNVHLGCCGVAPALQGKGHTSPGAPQPRGMESPCLAHECRAWCLVLSNTSWGLPGQMQGLRMPCLGDRSWYFAFKYLT